jgi:murein DD-endopeptidase MepM/ murein hydrolase activator NlpD
MENIMAKQIFETLEGKKKLQDELSWRKGPERNRIKEAIAVAKGFGDLSENSEYDEARESQAKNEHRITELEEMLKKYQEQQAAEANAKLLWPVDAKYRRISSKYGWRNLWGEKDFHLGIDIVGARKGEIAGANVYASAAGTVITAKYHNSYGYYILIDHGNTISTLYAHCSKLLVKAGQKVSRGQVIAYVGLTGNTSGYHLHYEVRKNGSTTDPLAKNGNSKESWLVMLNSGSYVDPIKNGLLTFD